MVETMAVTTKFNGCWFGFSLQPMFVGFARDSPEKITHITPVDGQPMGNVSPCHLHQSYVALSGTVGDFNPDSTNPIAPYVHNVHMFGHKEFYVLTVQSCPIKHPKRSSVVLFGLSKSEPIGLSTPWSSHVISTASQLMALDKNAASPDMKTTHWRPLIPGLQLANAQKLHSSKAHDINQPPTSKRSALPSRCAQTVRNVTGMQPGVLSQK